MSYRCTFLLLSLATGLGWVIPEAIASPSSNGFRFLAESYQAESHQTEAIAVPTTLQGLAPRQSAPLPTLLAQATAPASSAPLNVGSQGEGVIELQLYLKQLGYYDGVIDGIYGNSTQQSVSQFQQQTGLPVTGQVNAATWERLRASQSGTDISSIFNPDGAPAAPPAAPAEALDPPEAQPSDGSAAPEAAPEAAADEPADEPSAAPAAEQQRYLWLLRILALLIVLGGVLYIIRLVMVRSQSIKLQKLPEPAFEPESALPSEQPIAVTPSTEAAPPSPSNGYVQSSAQLATPAPGQGKASGSLQPNVFAVEETTRMAKVNIIEELVNDLHNPDPLKRRKAIWELGQRGNSSAIKPLIDLMMDSDSNQRSLILAAISEIGVQTLKPMSRALLISLQDESADVRKNAIRDLTRIYDQIVQVSNLLRHAAEDGDSEVQETARWALGQLNRIRESPEMEGAARLQHAADDPASLPEGGETHSGEIHSE